MSQVTVSLQDPQPAYRPGDRLAGTATWVADSAPKSIEVRLFWVASGASPQQIGLVETDVIAAPTVAGSHRFQFALPDGPWSFMGRLMQLTWFVEVILLPSQLCARSQFVLGPVAAPITTITVWDSA